MKNYVAQYSRLAVNELKCGKIEIDEQHTNKKHKKTKSSDCGNFITIC